MSEQAIKAIFGHEPMREGEYPTDFIVGQKAFGPDLPSGKAVTKIVRREENYGDHSLLWFDVYAGDDLIRSMQGRAVSEIHWDHPAALNKESKNAASH